MIGGLVHEYCLDRIEAGFRKRHWRVWRPYSFMQANERRAVVDMCCVDVDDFYVFIEVEMGTARLQNDLIKFIAHSRRGGALLIVSTNAQRLRRIKNKLAQLQVAERRPWLHVLTLGQALLAIERDWVVVPVSQNRTEG